MDEEKQPNLDTERRARDTPAMDLLGAHSPKEFILSMRDHYRRRDWSIPLKTWSERLGYKSERSLGMLIEGTRLPSMDMIERLAKDYGLTDHEKRYLQLLVMEKKEATESPRSIEVQKELQTLRAKRLKQKRQLSIADYGKVFHWYVFVIRQLVYTKGFREDFSWIRRRLRNKVTSTEIEHAIQTLLELGGLSRDPEGKLQMTPGSFLSPDGVPSNLIREHHHEMINRAKESINQMGVHERDLSSWTFTVDREDLPAIRKSIREFRESLNEKFSKKNSNAVFQLNVQLFEHTIDIGESCED